jgi:hypothetical protein
MHVTISSGDTRSLMGGNPGRILNSSKSEKKVNRNAPWRRHYGDGFTMGSVCEASVLIHFTDRI